MLEKEGVLEDGSEIMGTKVNEAINQVKRLSLKMRKVC